MGTPKVVNLNRFRRSRLVQERLSGVGHSARRHAKESLATVLVAVRLVAFYLLMWLRLPVKFLLAVVWIPCLVGLALLALIRPDESRILWILGSTSFGAFVAGWMYDGLLLLLSPEPLVLDTGRTTRD